MLAHAAVRITPDEYLALDRAAEFRSEYIDGEMFAMSGGSRTHSAVAMSLGSELRSALRGKGCIVTGSDMRLQLSPNRNYVYPDVVVRCGAPTSEEADIETAPTVVFEVLSPSTERWDRVKKFALYRQVASVREYCLVAQDELRIEWFTRKDSGDWVYQSAEGLEGLCRLESLGVTLSLSNIYEDVGLPVERAEE